MARRKKTGLPTKIRLEAMSKETLPVKAPKLSGKMPNIGAMVPKMPKDAVKKPSRVAPGAVRLLKTEHPVKPPKMKGDKFKVEKPPKPKKGK